MDIRIEKTERAIKQAFLTLRAKKPLEKIKVKDLCALACINKSTFYAHYQDIFALSTKMEQDLVEVTLRAAAAAWRRSAQQHRLDDPGAVPSFCQKFGDSAGALLRVTAGAAD